MVPGLSSDEKLGVFRRAVDLLASSRSFEETMAHTIRSFLPTLGDFGFFDLVVESEVRRTARAHEDERIEAILRPTRWVRQERTDMNLCALSTGREALHRDIGDDWYRAIAVNEGHLAVLRDLAFKSMITVPMRYQGELLGALTLFHGRSGRQHGDDELAFGLELANLAAPLVANARLVEQLRISEERLRIGMDAGKLGVWDWDISKNRISWSDRVYDLHGLVPGHFGAKVEDFETLVYPEDRARVQEAIDVALRDGSPYIAEFRVQFPDGSLRWLATRAEVFRDPAGAATRLIGATYDVTERQQLLANERAAREEAERTRGRIELLAHSVQLFSRSLDVDETLETIAHLLVPEIVDWCRIDLVGADGMLRIGVIHHGDPVLAAHAAKVAQRTSSDPETVGSIAWIAANRRAHTLHIDAAELERLGPQIASFARAIGLRTMFGVPLVTRDRCIGVLTILYDRSSVRELTAETRALVEELASRAALAIENAQLYSIAERARAEAEAANRAKDEFLAMLGHELRNPLAPIVTALHLMEAQGNAASQRERAVIGRQVTHMIRLVDDLLDIARISRGKITLERERVDIVSLLEKTVESFREMLAPRRLTVSFEIERRPLVVDGDPVRLAQVVGNLLANAAKFSPDGERIDVRISASAETVEVVVSDRGSGIAPELLPHVFELFTQGPQQLARKNGGLGLGLAIVANLVALHGGSVTGASDGVGRGATFRVCLPLAAAIASESSAPTSATSASAAKGMRILLVDDNHDAGELLADYLRVLGHDVQLAEDATSALALLHGFKPEVALLDIGLPDMNGYELARALRERAGPHVRLIAVTGYGLASDRLRAKEAGFDEHLVKPIDPLGLARQLAQLSRDEGT